MTATNVIIAKGHANQVTVSTTRVEQNITKVITIVTPPTTNQNKAEGPSTSMIVDLMMIEYRWMVDGYIDVSDRVKFESLPALKGITMEYLGVDILVNMEKCSIVEESTDSDTSRTSDETYSVKFTVVKGTDMI